MRENVSLSVIPEILQKRGRIRTFKRGSAERASSCLCQQTPAPLLAERQQTRRRGTWEHA